MDFTLKILSPEHLINLWPASLANLRERVLNYLPQEISKAAWFPDIEIVFPERLKQFDNIHVIFFGGYLERFFETGNWPSKNYHFYALSSRVKKVFQDLMLISADQFSVIPRDHLQTKPSSVKHLDLNSKITLVYAGRISSQKNIESVLGMTRILQDSIDIELLMLGNFDDFVPRNRGRFIIDSYSDEIHELIKRLNFKKAPKIIHNLDQKSWPKQIPNNSLMVNFSTFVCEDFGLALTEAYELGIPLLISDWGGHIDLIGENIHLVDKKLISESQCTHDALLLKSEILAEHFLQFNFTKNSKQSPTKFTIPKPLSLTEINAIRADCILRFGSEIALLGQDRMSLFASTKNGELFFKYHSIIFSGKS